MEKDAGHAEQSRWQTIQAAVQQPIGILALTILVIESLGLGFLAVNRGANSGIALIACGLVCLLICGAVLFVAWKNPDALRGTRYVEPIDRKSITAPLETTIQRLQEKIEELQAKNEKLTTSLKCYESLEAQIIALLINQSLSLTELQKKLYGSYDNLAQRNELLGALGSLITAGKIGHSVGSIESYTLLRS